jgi:tight adherence protein C
VTMIQLIIPLLTFISVLCLGAAAITGTVARREVLQARLHGVKSGREDEIDDRPLHVRFITRLGGLVSTGTPSKNLRTQLVKAGFQGRGAIYFYMGAKMFLLSVGLVLFGLPMTIIELPLAIKALSIIGGSALLFFIPNMVLSIRSESRRAEVARHLPDVVDMLEICVSGGMGLDMAWNAVGDEVRAVSPLLADEMALTNLEMHLGEERGRAIRNMAARTGAEELDSLVALLVQAHKFGTSISDALRIYAGSMRELRSQRAEEQAEKMAVKMLFPMVVLVFPVVIIVAVGPACITLMEVLG